PAPAAVVTSEEPLDPEILPDPLRQRPRMRAMRPAGVAAWTRLPDLAAVINCGNSLNRQLLGGIGLGALHPSEGADQFFHRFDHDRALSRQRRAFEHVDLREEPGIRLTPRSDTQNLLHGRRPRLFLQANELLEQLLARTQTDEFNLDVVLRHETRQP